MSLALDERAARSLSNYQLNQVALKGYWQCQPAAQAQCLWRLTGGDGLIYSTSCGHGLSMFVNTSIDGSLGLLAKSPAWVAFCRCLIGPTDQVRQFCFSTDQRPVLRIPDREVQNADYKARDERTAVSVENCDGSKARAVSQGSLLLLPAATGLGWMKTTDEPVLYAGINLPAGETDLTAPTQEQIADVVQRVFVQAKDRGPDAEGASSLQPSASSLWRKPVWPIFAWAAMFLLVLESAVANRLKR
jgi:hypothetical protein